MIKTLMFVPFVVSISLLQASEPVTTEVVEPTEVEEVANVGETPKDEAVEKLEAVEEVEAVVDPGPPTMYVEPVVLSKRVCTALLAATGEKIEKVLLKDKNKKPVRLQGAGTLDEEVTVVGNTAFHFSPEKTVEDLKGANLLTRKIGFSSYCEYSKGSAVIARVFKVISEEDHKSKYPGQW